MERKLLWVLCALSIFTFTTSLFSSLLIFFNDNNHTKVNANSVVNKKTRYKRSMIVFENGNRVDLRNIGSGFEKNYQFSVTNDNSDIIDYRIQWSGTYTDWNTSDYQFLLYALSCDNGVVLDNQNMPLTNEKKDVISSLKVNSNKTVVCDIKIKYKASYIEQTNNMFISDIDVFING